MPFAVGATKIWGTPSPLTPAPTGWVRTDGFTDYTDWISGLSFQNAPFGGYLGFRHGYSNNIPSPAIKYYRWSYRKVGETGGWGELNEPVTRRYVKQSPGLLPTFPVDKLGPDTVGGKSNLFKFKPSSPPGPEPGDPPGTITYWPTDDTFGDIYTGYLSTVTIPPNIADGAGHTN